ncbi:hypothetical protein A2U01_0065905, partial [Trifolium medium]|nr:hypothetical protein [Trifolium medium]
TAQVYKYTCRLRPAQRASRPAQLPGAKLRFSSGITPGSGPAAPSAADSNKPVFSDLQFPRQLQH